MINGNPYESPRTNPLPRRRIPSVTRMMFGGLIAGTLVGLGAGAVAGAALLVALWILATSQYSVSDPITVAEYGSMQVFHGVFSGAIVGFALLAPLGVVLGIVATFWQPLSKRAYTSLTAVVLAAVFAAAGALVPEWPSPFSALVTGVVGIGGGIMLGRVLAEMAHAELARAKGSDNQVSSH